MAKKLYSVRWNGEKYIAYNEGYLSPSATMTLAEARAEAKRLNQREKQRRGDK